MSDAAVHRDELGEALGFRQDEQTGTWWGRCPQCSADRASVGLKSLACTECGPMTLELVKAQFGGLIDESPRVIRASDVEPEVVRWLWRSRLPFGKLSGLVGDPGLGKSTVALDIAARLTLGATMPDETLATGPANVLVLSAEDGLGDTIVPRLEAAGANLHRVIFLPDKDKAGELLPHRTIPAAIGEIEAVVEAEQIRLVLLDPLGAFLPAGINSWNDAAVRGALAPLAAMAERTGAAVWIVAHLNKAASQSAIYRVGGSIGIVAALRSVLVVAKDPDDDDRRVLASLKANLAHMPASLAFTLAAEDNGAVHVGWHGESKLGVEQLLAVRTNAEDRTAIDEAADFVTGILAEGPRWATDVQADAKSLDIAERTLTRAKKRLGVRSQKSGPDGGWLWSLPAEDVQGDAKGAYRKTLAALGEESPESPHDYSVSSKEANVAVLGDQGGQVAAEGGQAGALREKRSTERFSGTTGPEGGQPGHIEHLRREVLEL